MVAILLPALGKARAAGHQAVCLSNLRQAGMGFATYAADFRDYVAGPNTSGLHFFGALTAQDRSWVVSDNPAAPLQADDWMSPTLGRSLGAPTKRADRLMHFFNHEFRCPANALKYDYKYGSAGGFPDAKSVNYNSYSAPLPLHAYANAAEMRAAGQQYGATLGGYDDQAVNIAPSGHRFRMDTLGSPALKATALDGARYLGSDGRISFNANRAGEQYGQNFMTRSPALNVIYPDTGNPYRFSGYPNLNPLVRNYTYRHANESINVGFFDGHAENLTNLESRRIDYYFPSGSVVVSTGGLGDPNIRRGYVVR